jgi:hypothetical protein
LEDDILTQKEFNKQSHTLARNLRTELLKLNAPASRVEQAFKALSPQQFGSAEQAILFGTTMGDEAALEGGVEARRVVDESQIDKFRTQEEIRTDNAIRLAREKARMTGTKPPTEAQKQTQLFASRMNQANKDLEKIIEAGFDPSAISTSIQQSTLFETDAGNRLRSSANQQYSTLRKNFVTAVMRKESGAAIAESELETAMQIYFPQPGDSKETIAQKRRNRMLATSLMQQAGGIPVDSLLFINETQEGVKLRGGKNRGAANIPGYRKKPAAGAQRTEQRSGIPGLTFR